MTSWEYGSTASYNFDATLALIHTAKIPAVFDVAMLSNQISNFANDKDVGLALL